MQCKSLEQLATDFNKRFAVGKRFKVDGLPALGVGEMVSSAYIAGKSVMVDLQFGDNTIPTNTAHLLIAGDETWEFEPNYYKIKWAEVVQVEGSPFYGDVYKIIDCDKQGFVTRELNISGKLVFFNNGNPFKIAKITTHPKAKEASHE